MFALCTRVGDIRHASASMYVGQFFTSEVPVFSGVIVTDGDSSAVVLKRSEAKIRISMFSSKFSVRCAFHSRSFFSRTDESG